MTAKQHDIFISYSRKDIEMMYKIRDALRAGGAVVWTDEYLKPHTPEWESAIEHAIGESRGLVIICSPESKNSKWVRIELKWADIKGLDIFPLLISGTEETSIPTSLITHQYIDAREDTIGKISILVDSVKERFGIIGIEELQAEIRVLTAQLNVERQRVTDLAIQLEQAARATDDNSALQEELRQAKATITRLQTELQTQTAQVNTLKSQLDEQTNRANTIQHQHDKQSRNAQTTITSLENQLKSAKGTIADLQNQLTSAQIPKKVTQNKVPLRRNPWADIPPKMRKLQAWNPYHWVVLLWWILATPNKIKEYTAQYGYKTQNYIYSGLEPIQNWLFSTLVWLPSATSLSIISLGLAPIASKEVALYIPPILLSVIISLWISLGLFAHRLDNLIHYKWGLIIIVIGVVFVGVISVGVGFSVSVGVGLFVNVGAGIVIGIVMGLHHILSIGDGVILGNGVLIWFGSSIGVSIKGGIFSGLTGFVLGFIVMLTIVYLIDKNHRVPVDKDDLGW
ncbi:MAG: TIR domain-containing protein [Anaerolineae bacterium]|nr:TIR domain-containing protein [Anaerolineae bacterium]